ncbi:MAG: hypothetical protein IH996_07245 [Proteobacteria bacterium]|nr:hypothetical protein [Pseudomonadota bacterium]
MQDETISANEIIARFKAMRSELSRLKRRQFSLKLHLARIYVYQFLLRLVRPKVKAGYDIVYYVKKCIGHDRPSNRPLRTADLRYVGLSTKKPSEDDQT